MQVQKLADDFVRLFAEALGLPPDGLAKFYDTPEKMQHRSKLVQYPVVNERSESDQGVGPHYDAGFVTIVSRVSSFSNMSFMYCGQLLQATDHRGLQVQNLAGQWIDAPPKRGTFVVSKWDSRSSASANHLPR